MKDLEASEEKLDTVRLLQYLNQVRAEMNVLDVQRVLKKNLNFEKVNSRLPLIELMQKNTNFSPKWYKKTSEIRVKDLNL